MKTEFSDFSYQVLFLNIYTFLLCCNSFFFEIKPRGGCTVSLNPYSPNVTFLYPLKTSENQGFFWRFQGVQKCNIGRISCFMFQIRIHSNIISIINLKIWFPKLKNSYKPIPRQWSLSIPSKSIGKKASDIRLISIWWNFLKLWEMMDCLLDMLIQFVANLWTGLRYVFVSFIINTN